MLFIGGFDPYFFILIIAFLFSLYAQVRVKSVYAKYRNIHNKNGISGARAAREILDINGLYDVKIDSTQGELTDHYDSRTKTISLSSSVFLNTSIASLGVAAHEAGHAIQNSIGYKPLVLRNILVPVAGIGSSIGPYLAIFGLIAGFYPLVQIGIAVFSAAVLFYLVTLPVELNASSRAIKTLENSGIISYDEVAPARKVLNAAAMTYLAAALVAVATLLRLIFLAGRRR
jgi:uncharacterized protein